MRGLGPEPDLTQKTGLALTAAAPTLHVGAWADWGAACGAVRTAVFVREQGIDPADEWDADDARATHAVLLDAGGTPLATGRLIDDGAGQGRVGRMAVLAPQRGRGLGTVILRALLDAAHAQGLRQVRLHAQCHAQPFYARAGFAVQGEPFDEVGIAHVEMAITLPS